MHMQIQSCSSLLLMLLVVACKPASQVASADDTKPERHDAADHMSTPVQKEASSDSATQETVQRQSPPGASTESRSRMVANASLDENGKLQATVGDLSVTVSARNCEPLMETLVECEQGAELAVIGPSGKERQNLRLSAFYLNPQATVYRGPPDGSYRKDDYSIIVSDVNSDGREDLAIQTGKLGSYGGLSYDIYLYDPASKAFVINQQFSDLTVGHIGMFIVSDGRISASSKSGCCIHTSETYVIEKNRPKLVERVTEDATRGYPKSIRAVERLIDGKLQQVQAGQQQSPFYAAPESKEVSKEQRGSDIPIPELRKSFNECMNATPGVTYDMMNCMGAEFDYQDARLNAAYRRLRKTMALEQWNQLKTKQVEWIESMDSACKGDPNGGTAQMLEIKMCALNRTASRADKLESVLSQTNR